MKELLNNIDIHKTKENMEICYILVNYIIDNKINSLIELRAKEDSYFSTQNIIERLDICYKEILTDYCHLEEFDQNGIDKLVKYRDLYNRSDDIYCKINCIIYMYDMLGWEFLLPYHAYKLIIKDTLK